MFYLLDTVQALLPDTERVALVDLSVEVLRTRLRNSVDRAVHGRDPEARQDALRLSWALVAKAREMHEYEQDRVESEVSVALRAMGAVDGGDLLGA